MVILNPCAVADPLIAEFNRFFNAGEHKPKQHRPAKSRVTTMNHLLDVLDDSVARMKGVNHFFIVIGKDFLEYIHVINMREMKEKENPDSPHE